MSKYELKSYQDHSYDSYAAYERICVPKFMEGLEGFTSF